MITMRLVFTVILRMIEKLVLPRNILLHARAVKWLANVIHDEYDIMTCGVPAKGVAVHPIQRDGPVVDC